ncbi:CsaB protein [Halalkalibacter wakoensis JCM 9140]|uniref:CsaB protein n=1 Tax=Halalkalibacter wakoensis JCM 9140 TaxID=1236970 RepID=W4Q715_9BACI|nr:polysaccharide pyruvyl transferase family protein [Halalkalibacter wakoensis]GAE27463.1 CsaB protein [Halalkalibacter wakoensis JCM 9140]
MKVGIIGNYGHNNNGDEAILTGILHQLTVEVGIKKEDIVIFSNNPDNTKARYDIQSVPLLYKEGNVLASGLKTVKESHQVMKKLDLLIIGGGGLLMDMYKRDAPLYSVLGMTGRRAGCKVIIYGVGAGPITTRAGRFFIRRLTQAARSISVRDQDSKKLLQSIGVQKNIEVIGDPAFSVPALKKHEPSKKIKKVGVTAVPYFSTQYWPEPDVAKYEAYVDGMAASLDRLIVEKEVEVTFFSTKYPEDVQVTKDIQAKMTEKDRVTLIDDNLHPTDIVSISAEQDLIIGTRLHSLILSVVAQTPIIGIGYHHKVHDFMDVLNRSELGVKIDHVRKETTAVFDVFETIEQKWETVQDDFVTVSKRLKEEAKLGLKQIIK